jgi:hypothetical protein
MQPDHVPDLVDELRISGQFAGVDQVRLEPNARYVRKIAVWFKPLAR